MKADCDVHVTYEGDNTVLLISVRMPVLARFVPLMSFKIARSIVDILGEPKANQHIPVERVINDPESQVALFCECQNRVNARLRKDLQLKVASGLSDAAAWNECSLASMALSKIFIERYVLQLFIAVRIMFENECPANLH